MYDTPNADLEVRRDKRRASGFQPDPEMERLLEMREKEPEKFDRLGSSFVMQVGYYQSRKAAAERLEKEKKR